MTRIKKTFEVETSPAVMERLERFLALLHHNSNFGHSALFGMWLDGDGSDKVKVIPTPKFSDEVGLIGGVGDGVEIAGNGCYTVRKTASYNTSWIVKPGACLYKDDKLHKAIPSAIYRD